jgi:rhamnogalacturonyl hydrolase YesR
MAMPTDADLHLEWPISSRRSKPGLADAGWLSLTTATDDREEKVVGVRLTRSHVPLGEFDLRRAPSLSSFRLRLPAGLFAQTFDEGVSLSLRAGQTPLWWLAPGVPETAAPLAPHLLLDRPTNPLTEFFLRLASPASLQPFGWMEGCVLDGLHDLARSTGEPRFQAALESHLAAFFPGANQLVHEDPRGEPADNRVTSIESTLPFAVLAQLDPAHPCLEIATAFWAGHTDAQGRIQDDGLLSAEGNYTVAYPLAVIGALRRDPTLLDAAAAQLRLRRSGLWHDGALALRRSDRGEYSFRNWTRGCAWYFLGLVRTLEHLAGRDETSDLVAEVRSTAHFIRSFQRHDGLWGGFLDDPHALPDTSGSAGLAAALARGAAAGWLADEDLAAARQTWIGLQSHLTSDGFLGGASPSNRGGERLQRSSYRVLSPMGMGLMGQLAAALAVEINFPQTLSMHANDNHALVG